METAKISVWVPIILGTINQMTNKYDIPDVPDELVYKQVGEVPHDLVGPENEPLFSRMLIEINEDSTLCLRKYLRKKGTTMTPHVRGSKEAILMMEMCDIMARSPELIYDWFESIVQQFVNSNISWKLALSKKKILVRILQQAIARGLKAKNAKRKIAEKYKLIWPEA